MVKIVRISAVWCPSCIVTYNDFIKLKDVYDAEFVELDYDYDDIEKFNVGDILPIIVVLDDDENELVRIIGEKKFNNIKEIIDEKTKNIN